jgi:thiol-disulfide isomerase/thioredoxin
MKLWLVLFLLVVSASTICAQENLSLEGQVVCCADCWGQADRTRVEYGTAENLLKAKSCVENGDPTLLAVREQDTFTLYGLVPRRYRLPGKNWLEFIGKRVAVTGKVENKKSKVFRVDSLQVLATSLAEQQAEKTIGTEVELKLKDLGGVEQSLASLKGRLVILNFWATYCIPCRAEMPDLAAIQNEFAALGVQVIGASTDEPGDHVKVLQFIREMKINFPIWMGATTKDMVRFGLGGALPGTIVIGKDGKVVKVIWGVINKADLKRDLERLTSQPIAEHANEKRQVVSRDPRGEVSSVPS